MTCILNIVNSASLISWDHVAMKILVLNSSLYGWPLWCLPPSYRDWNICMFEVNKIIISFQITETYPKIWKKNISVTYHLKITQVYPNRISKISSKHSKHHWPRLELSVAPWTLRRSASRCSACEPDPLEKAKTEDPKGPRENDLHMVGPWESQVGDHNLMNCWIYEVYSQWDLRVYIIVSVVWLPVVGFIDCCFKHDRTI